MEAKRGKKTKGVLENWVYMRKGPRRKVEKDNKIHYTLR